MSPTISPENRYVHDVSDNVSYLIIGGTTKAGTTSLFSWLSDHPQVAPSATKETRFFLEEEYPLPAFRHRVSNSGLNLYEAYFGIDKDKIWRLEATPDYLYSVRAAENISTYLKSVTMVFVLRDPIDRLVSWFNFSKQRGLLSSKKNFHEYIAQQMVDGVDDSTPQHMRALSQGCYSKFLDKNWSEFPKNRIHLVIYEDMVTRPGDVMRELCALMNVNNSAYDDYKFKAFNQTLSPSRLAGLTRARLWLKFHVARFAIDKPRMLSGLRKFNRIFLCAGEQPRGSSTKFQANQIDPDDMKILIDYYRKDIAEVKIRMGGRELPWFHARGSVVNENA